MAPRRTAAPPPGATPQRRPATKVAGPVWACNCGFKTNWASNKACYRCAAAKGMGRPLVSQAVGPSQRAPAQAAARTAKAAASASAPPTPETKIISEDDKALHAARALVISWEHMLKQHPGTLGAITGLNDSNAEVRAIKSRIESGKSHTERLHTAVTRQTQAAKEHKKADSEHAVLLAEVDISATRLAAAVAKLTEAEETLTSLQVEGAGPMQSPPIPAHLQANTFFAVWHEAAKHMGWHLTDPAAFDAMAALIFARNDAQATGVPIPGVAPGPQGAPPPQAAPPPSGPAASAAQSTPASRAAPVPASASGPSFFGPRSFGPTPHEARGQDLKPPGRGRSSLPRGRFNRPTGLDSHFNTTGVSVPTAGAWAIPVPSRSVDPNLEASGFSTPNSHRSRSRSPPGAPDPQASDGNGPASGTSVGGPSA
jgi:hypothetical protein